MATPPLEVLTRMAVYFNVSQDYLVGIDKNEMVSISGLTEGQQNLIHALIGEMKKDPVKYPGLTDMQQDILNRIMIEFSKKHK